MDESGARLVHGGVERFSDLEAVCYRRWNGRTGFRWIQNACVRSLFGYLSGNRGIRHKRIKIGCGPSATETRTDCAHGAVAKSAAEDFDVVQETRHSVF